MIRSTATSLAGLAIAALLAWALGGVRGTGVIMGYLAGAGLAGLGICAQRYVAVHMPTRLFQVHLLAFLLKLAAIGLMALAFKTNEHLARIADFGAFALSFAAAVAVILPIGAMDTARIGRPTR